MTPGTSTIGQVAEVALPGDAGIGRLAATPLRRGAMGLKRCATVAVAALSLTAGTPALAATPAIEPRPEAFQSGACSDGADWRLTVQLVEKRLEVVGFVDSNRRGQRWRWVIKHNGSVSARGTKRTQPPNGSFRVVRRVVDIRDVEDKLVFRAKHAGQVCRGVVNYPPRVGR